MSTDIWLVTEEYFEEYKSLPNQTGLHEILFNLGANTSYFSALSGDFSNKQGDSFLIVHLGMLRRMIRFSESMSHIKAMALSNL